MSDDIDEKHFVPKGVAVAIHAVFVGLIGALLAWSANRIFTNSLIINGLQHDVSSIERRVTSLENRK